MKFHQNFNEMAIRPYGRGYRAPSTALFNTDLATVEIMGEEESIDSLEIIKMPDFIEVLVEFAGVPLPLDQNYTATYGFDEITWPAAPLYPAHETQYVSALKLIYADVIKVRQQGQHESMLIRGKNIDGFEIKVTSGEALYTHQFDYQNSSIDFHVIQKKINIPVWPIGGFYRPGCQIDQIQQAFCSLIEQDHQTFIRKTLLHQWNDKGFYPPSGIIIEEQKTIFQTPRTQPYLKFIEEVQQGKIMLEVINPQVQDQVQAVCFSYKSIDIKEQGISKALVSFVRV